MRDDPDRNITATAQAERDTGRQGTMSLSATIAIGLSLGALIALVGQLF